MCDDQRFQYLLDQVNQRLNLPLRRKLCLSELIAQIQRSPRLLHSRHPDYDEALHQTLLWVVKKINGFKPESPPPTQPEDFMSWVNGYLSWRIKDLKRPDVQYAPTGFRSVLNHSSCDDGNASAESEIPDLTPSLSSLDELIKDLQAKQLKRTGQEIRAYIEQDPEGILGSCHLRQNSAYNCQVLAVRIHLQEPPATVRAVAAEFGVREQALYTHWRTKCQPLLRLIALRFDEPLKQEIVSPELKESLSQVQLEGHPECNCWNLSEQLLLTNPAVGVQEIAQAMHLPRVADVWQHWEGKCLPILKQFRS